MQLGPHLQWRLTRDKRFDLAYSGLFVAAFFTIVCLIILFTVTDTEEPSCERCVLLSCYPAYGWCDSDTAAAAVSGANATDA